jgi:hypothetical protein
MIANAISRIIVRVSCSSLTSNAPVRPVLLMSQGASPKYRDSAIRSKPIDQSGAFNHTIPAPQRPLSDHRAPLKSP